MVEGAIRHGTSMKVEGNYVDSYGQSEIGFGITRLLGFDLLPRIKQINKVRLYRPQAGEGDAYPRLSPALTRPINWEIVETNYDQMIKYATAIRQGTASTEAILRRFTPGGFPPGLHRDAGGRPRPAHHLRGTLPAVARAAARDQRRPTRTGSAPTRKTEQSRKPEQTRAGPDNPAILGC